MALAAFHPLLLNIMQFQFYLNLFTEYFSIFPHGTCSLSLTSSIFSFRIALLPFIASMSKSKTLLHITKCLPRSLTVFNHLSTLFPDGLSAWVDRRCVRTLQPIYSKIYGSHYELILVRSPLLKESKFVSFTPLTNMLKLGGYPCVHQVVSLD